jgi:two-component system LytT family response regulator
MADPDRIRTLIVDDEPLARRGLQLRLARVADIEVVGEAGDGAAAVEQVRALAPDLLFLDVQMPGLDGFATLRAIAPAQLPLVVFVTAYDHHAIRAFEAAASDYLLKPVDDARLEQALARVRRQRAERAASGHCARLLALLSAASGRPELTLDQALATVAAPPSPDPVLAIRDGNRTIRVRAAEIRWIDAAGDYMCIHTDAETYVLRATMRQLESRLDQRLFQRVHRSSIVNVARVREMRPHINGEYFLRLDCGHELKLSRSYKDKLALLR